MSVETSSERPRRERVREQLRRQTAAEITAAAFALLDAGGLAAVSLAAVGKAVGMTPPALYRYFGSREALVDDLVRAAYADLGSTVVAAAASDAAPDTAPDQVRVARIAHGYRTWALANPRRYMMLFADRPPDAPDPVDGVTAINRAMLVLLEALVGIDADGTADDDPGLDETLVRWGRAIHAPTGASPLQLRLAVLLWSRIHGLVTLEISGVFAGMGLDAGRLLDAEIRAALTEVGA
jgi:AcrR family transcriptional regulator